MFNESEILAIKYADVARHQFKAGQILNASTLFNQS